MAALGNTQGITAGKPSEFWAEYTNSSNFAAFRCRNTVG
jgi:hypothetical protein